MTAIEMRCDLRGWMICRLLSLLRLHGLDCENCIPSGSCRGEDMRKRLEELR
jgi:hypothetical protein